MRNGKTIFKAAKVALISLLAFTALSCNEKKTSGKTTITASFYPLYIMLMNICDGADVQLSLLAPSDTGYLHDYQLTTKDMQAIEKSDIIVVNGLGMEDFLDKVFETKIPRNVRTSEAPSHGKPVMYYDKTSKGAEAYELLGHELLGEPLELAPKKRRGIFNFKK